MYTRVRYPLVNSASKTTELQPDMASAENVSATPQADVAAPSAQLERLSRFATIGEIATGAVHNVGNVLNSVNLAIDESLDLMNDKAFYLLERISALLAQNTDNLAHFLSVDPQGVQLPLAFQRASAALGELQAGVLRQLNEARNHLRLASDIISTQQDVAKRASGLDSDVAALIEQVIKIQARQLEKRGIRIVTNLSATSRVRVDRITVINVFMNLLKNAAEALEGTFGERVIQLDSRVEGPMLVMDVSDNGRGIASDILPRLFTFGFTTRAEGHGFGLSDSKRALEGQGGRLSAFSAGVGKGARFSVYLPLYSETFGQATGS